MAHRTHKSDPFTGRSLVNQAAAPRGSNREWWDETRTELAHELGHRKMRAVIRGRDNIGGRRIA